MKKTVLFFSRCELTELYGSMNEYLSEEYNIIHVAYSNEEERILKDRYRITNVLNFKKLVKSISENEINSVSIEEIDKLLNETTYGKFNVNNALQANRTSKYLSYDDNIRLLKNYYVVWYNIFKQNEISIFVHEPVSLLMNQIAASFCKKYGAVYTTHILVKGNGQSQFNYMLVDDYNGIATTLNNNYNNITVQDIFQSDNEIKKFLDSFRKDFNVFFSQLGNGKVDRSRLLKMHLQSLYHSYKSKKTISDLDPIVDNIEVFMQKDNLIHRRVKNLKAYRGINFDSFDQSKNYYFYPMHLEPEAVVLYWADNRYTNQIKLIENIAAQLPPDVFLYVKDHPHSPGYRDVADYVRLKSIPNVKLLDVSISGKEVVLHSKGVITINGTAGFEALLLNKHVITFGNSFYNVSNRVYNLQNVFDLKEILYKINNYVLNDDESIYRFVLAYLNNLNDGFTDFYGNMHNVVNIDLKENGNKVARSFHNWFKNRNID